MALVQEKILSFEPSDSPDVVGYKMYMEEAPTLVTYDSLSFDLGAKTEGINLAELPDMTTKDGVYNIGIVAVDDAGNESSMSVVNDVPLDFQAPNPPGQIVITG